MCYFQLFLVQVNFKSEEVKGYEVGVAVSQFESCGCEAFDAGIDNGWPSHQSFEAGDRDGIQH